MKDRLIYGCRANTENRPAYRPYGKYLGSAPLRIKIRTELYPYPSSLLKILSVRQNVTAWQQTVATGSSGSFPNVR